MVDPQARTVVDVEAVQPAGGGQEPAPRVLGVEPRLDGVAGDGRPADLVGQRLPGGQQELQADQVEAGDRLGDRVLDLQAGVDLEEDELALGGEQELDGAGTDVADRLAQRDRRRGQAGPQHLVDH